MYLYNEVKKINRYFLIKLKYDVKLFYFLDKNNY